MGKDGKNAKRITATLKNSLFEEVERIAKNQRTSNSWVVRIAVEQYVEKINGGALLPLSGAGS